MTIERTSYVSDVTGLAALQVEEAAAAHRVTANARVGRDGVASIIVEVTDRRGNLLAREIVDSDAKRETAADRLLSGSRIERCGPWRVDPVHKNRRLVAEVTLRMSESLGSLGRERRATATSA